MHFVISILKKTFGNTIRVPNCLDPDQAQNFSVNNILFKYKVHRHTTCTSYIQYNTFERDTEISLRLV